MSSAYIIGKVVCDTALKSFIKIINIKGPKIDPCGTLQVIFLRYFFNRKYVYSFFSSRIANPLGNPCLMFIFLFMFKGNYVSTPAAFSLIIQ